jgi:hypothetical protein
LSIDRSHQVNERPPWFVLSGRLSFRRCSRLVLRTSGLPVAVSIARRFKILSASPRHPAIWRPPGSAKLVPSDIVRNDVARHAKSDADDARQQLKHRDASRSPRQTFGRFILRSMPYGLRIASPGVWNWRFRPMAGAAAVSCGGAPGLEDAESFLAFGGFDQLFQLGLRQLAAADHAGRDGARHRPLPLEHDPEKWKPVFRRDKRPRRSCAGHAQSER